MEATSESPNPAHQTAARIVAGLNDKQRQAVGVLNGPVLIVAGAGSGKTRVLTRRIAAHIATGVAPGSILAITFTNKAAGEMRQRVGELVGNQALDKMWVSTFHSACVRMLRAKGPIKWFSIVDAADAKKILKTVLQDMEYDDDKLTAGFVRNVANYISKSKNHLQLPQPDGQGDYKDAAAEIYSRYQQHLRAMRAYDFDDLLLETVYMLRQDPEALEYFQNQFRYILVDEYQDTNMAQYAIVTTLAGKHRNLCVVGDPDQCLVEGTLIETEQGMQKIENIKNGDQVLGAHSNGDLQMFTVQATHSQPHAGNVYRIETANGQHMLGTSEHLVPTLMKLGEKQYGVGVSCRGEDGWSIRHIRTSYTKPPKKTGPLRVWIVGTYDHEEDALQSVRQLSDKYNIPLFDPESEITGSALEETNIPKLFEDIDYSFEFPHHIGNSNECGNVTTVTMFWERTEKDFHTLGKHRVRWALQPGDEKIALLEGGLSIEDGEDGTLWATTLRDSYYDAISFAKKVAHHDAGIIAREIILDNVTYRLMPLASLIKGTQILVRDGKREETISTKIASITREPYKGRVYDLEIRDAHTYLADNILVHNSIYAFRGATIRNIVNFEKDWPDATVVVLEQNYRSTKRILEVANLVISSNPIAVRANLWTAQDAGEEIKLYVAHDDRGEAAFVVNRIRDVGEPGEHAVLYRTNAQSRVLEEALMKNGIAYKLVGGTKFYSRAEIKDAIAYLRFIVNPDDVLSFQRIVNTPRRGIGAATIEKIFMVAEANQVNMYEACKLSLEPELLGRGFKAVVRFVEFINAVKTAVEEEGPTQALDIVLLGVDGLRKHFEQTRTGDMFEAVMASMGQTGQAMQYLKNGREEGRDRVANLLELARGSAQFVESYAPATLALGGKIGELTPREQTEAFLEHVTLVSDLDDVDTLNAEVLLMTMHAAKGLEFPHVTIVGLEDGILPLRFGKRRLSSSDMEEERRLCYVAITRAEKTLALTRAQRRWMFGQTESYQESQFLTDIKHLLTVEIAESYVQSGAMYTGPVTRDTTRHRSIQKQLEKPVETPINMVVDARVLHPTWGEGTIIVLSGTSEDPEIEVLFDNAGRKKLLLRFAKITVIQ